MNINRKKIFLFVFAIIVIPISVTFLPLYIVCYITHTRFEWFNLWLVLIFLKKIMKM